MSGAITVHRGAGNALDNVVTVSSTPYTVLASDKILCVNLTSASRTINLLDPTVAANRHMLFVVVIGTSDANTCTLSTPAGVIGVGGAATWVLQGKGAALVLVPDGTDYQVFSLV